MVRRIDTLTDDHRATFAGWVDRWVAVGHQTGPLSEQEWAAVETAARRCYGFAGLAEPRLVLRVTSPLAGAVAAHVARRVAAARGRDGVGDGVRDGVGNGVRAGVGAGVRAGVWAGVGAGVRAGVWAGVGAGVWAGVWAGVGAGVGAGVRDGDDALLAPWATWLHEPIRQGLTDASHNWYNQWREGNLWCDWHAFASWFRDVAHLDLHGDLWDRFAADEHLTAAGPSWWYADLCVIADRPTVLHVETAAGQTRMHCADGPAIAWADGWAIHAWHGVTVPADLIETGWPVDKIMAEPNTEVRRCAIERLGWDRFVDDAGLSMVGNPAPDPGNPGHTLALYDVPDRVYDAPVRVLLATNATAERDGTRRRYGLTVPADIADPVAAAAWTFDLPTDTYRALTRAT